MSWAMRVALLLVAGCPSEPELRDAASASSSSPSFTSSAGVSSPSFASASTSAPTASTNALGRTGIQPFVLIPDGDSPEPTPAEWASAPTFNTSTAAGRVDECPIAVKREWVRFGCMPDLLFGVPEKGFGWRSNSNYLVLRLRRGDLFIIRYSTGSTGALSRVAWPSDAAGPTVAETWRAPQGALVVYPEPVQPIPDVPELGTERPRPADWLSGTPVNTAAEHGRPKNCELRVLRDWVQWRCSGNQMFYERSSGFGTPDVDFFKVTSLALQQGEARIKPGMSATFTISLTIGAPLTTIKIHWPVNEPKPSEISVQTAGQ
jgi:hypothetical protein